MQGQAWVLLLCLALGTVPAQSFLPQQSMQPLALRRSSKCPNLFRARLCNRSRSRVAITCSGEAKGIQGRDGAIWYGDTAYEDLPSASELAFDSVYVDKTGQPRGFCNWIVPGKVMLGRYPHGTPIGSKTGRPSLEESRQHIRKLLEAGVSVFVMLQEEVPAQDDDSLWPAGDLVPLKDEKMAQKYPMGFSRLGLGFGVWGVGYLVWGVGLGAYV